MTPRFDLGALQALCAIADEGNVTRAAASLALTQSAVSHKVRRLEESLGCALLSRRAGKRLFTAEGERLLAYARRIVALHDEAVLALGKKALAGTIRLGMTEDVSSGQLAQALGRFTRLYPQIQVRAFVAQSLQLEAALDAGAADLVIMQAFRHNLRPGDRVLGEASLHWVKSADWQPDFLRPLPYLAFDEHCFYRHWAMTCAAALSPGLVTVLECPSTTGIVSAVREGIGVTLLSSRYLTDDMTRLDDCLPPAPDIVWLLRAGRQPSAAVTALAEAFSERPLA